MFWQLAKTISVVSSCVGFLFQKFVIIKSPACCGQCSVCMKHVRWKDWSLGSNYFG